MRGSYQLSTCLESTEFHGMWRSFQVYRKRVGLEKWKDAFQVVRRNCETDWAQKCPQYVVSTWIGYGIEVSDRLCLSSVRRTVEKC